MTLTLASTAVSGQLGQGLVLMVVGMGVVFFVLVLLSVLIGIMNREVKPAQALTPDVAPASVAEGEIPPEHLAVIAAAVAVAAGPRARISRLVFLGHSSQREWVAGGRATVMGSHRPNARRW